MNTENLNILLTKYLEILELEINQFGFKPTEIRHLIGRIGEFQCAIKMGGSLSYKSNQKGYDVICSANRKISVKTTAQKTGFITFNKSTLNFADDVMIIQYADNEFREIFFGAATSIIQHCRTCNNNFELDLSKIKKFMN